MKAIGVIQTIKHDVRESWGILRDGYEYGNPVPVLVSILFNPSDYEILRTMSQMEVQLSPYVRTYDPLEGIVFAEDRVVAAENRAKSAESKLIALETKLQAAEAEAARLKAQLAEYKGPVAPAGAQRFELLEVDDK